MTSHEPGDDAPLVSIVTPTFNMGRYLDEAIRSVLSQTYPRIEYVVMDGGSTDETPAILERYASKLRWFSSPDNGTADAINKAFQMTSGDICAWLSADDAYLPGAVAAAVAAFDDPATGVVYGEGLWTDASGSVLGRYPTSPRAVAELDRECRICQPAVFIRRASLERAGFLNARLSSAFDYDLWVRLSLLDRFKYLNCDLATSRMHAGNKTIGQRTTALHEAMRVQGIHFGYVPFTSVYAYCSWLMDRRDPLSNGHQPSLLSAALSLPVGMWVNRSALGRYAHDWGGALNRGVSRLVGVRKAIQG